jgi:hypothetical protein
VIWALCEVADDINKGKGVAQRAGSREDEATAVSAKRSESLPPDHSAAPEKGQTSSSQHLQAEGAAVKY